jgi:hypothetical protein
MTDTQFVDVLWGNEDQTFLRWNFHGDWSGKSYFDSLVHLWHLLDTKDYPLNLLIDMRQSGKSPSNLIAMMQAAVRTKQPCQIKHVVVISHTSYWESVYEIACRHSAPIAALDIQFVASDSAAHSLLNQFDI